MSKQEIAILGGGNMGRAIVGGLLRRGTRPEHIRVGEHLPAAREAFSRDLGVAAIADNAQAIDKASVVVLAVKPQDAQSVLRSLQDALQRNPPLLISIVAGIRLASLESWCGPAVPVVRSMPNRPAFVGAGATALFAPPRVTREQRSAAERVMQAAGEVVWVATEDQLDHVTALSGSGPAYLFYVTELMTQAAVELGLDPAAARRLGVATLYGAGQLAYASDGDLERLRAEVTSKAGTTEAAIRILESADLRGIIKRALEAGVRRSQELAAQFGQST